MQARPPAAYFCNDLVTDIEETQFIAARIAACSTSRASDAARESTRRNMLNLKGAVDASLAHFSPLSMVALQPVCGPSVEPGDFLDGVHQAVGPLSIKPLTNVPVPQWMTRVWSSCPPSV